MSLIGSGFVASDLTTCAFGLLPSPAVRYVSSTIMACKLPPSDVLQPVTVGLALNGVQPAVAAQRFTYVSLWTPINALPRVGREVGGTTVNVLGLNFADTSRLSCKFGDVVVQKPYAAFISSSQITCIAPRQILARYPWETNRSYAGFVTNNASCAGHIVPGRPNRLDPGWTVCAGCTDCCQCPHCPECLQRFAIPPPQCACREGEVPCTIPIAVPPNVGRSLCLPPQFRCFWAPRQDPTFSSLQCNLLNFTGKVCAHRCVGALWAPCPLNPKP